jgi:hypothetical protein
MIFETVAYGGWQTCYRLANDKIELIVTGEVGPRVLHFGFIGGANVMHQVQDDLGKSGDQEYRFYGGHRLWHSPEARPRTYAPDNAPVEHFELDDVHYFIPPAESTGIQKQMCVRFRDDTVIIDHTISNNGLWPVELAPWSITVLRAGGIAIVPLPPHVSHESNLLPTHALTLWGYTGLNDERLYYGNRVILVRQDSAAAGPIKIGLQVVPDYLWSVGWLAYVNDGVMFVKSFQPVEGGATYPDLGSQVEVFTNSEMIELESLGPLKALQPEETVTHREYWSLHKDVPLPHEDMDIGQNILPMIREVHPTVGRRSTGTFRAV